MRSQWENLWLWITIILGGIALLAVFSLLLPLLVIFLLPFFIGFFLWLLVVWLRSLIPSDKPHTYDEMGARYTPATIISKNSTSSEGGNETDHTQIS